MQEDSPGRQEKRIRNERYNTPTKPKRLSVSTAKHKAKEFAAKDDKSTRVLAKQAILKELNTQLVVNAQGIAPQNRRKEDKAGNDSEYLKLSKIKGEERKPTKLASKIPRRIDRTYADATADQKRVKSLLRQEQKYPRREATSADKSDERTEEKRKRHLAEKYISIWRRKTYGRVTPSMARIHYERKLKQHTLELWQDIWWSGRKGWKLNVRADYHNRYRLWQKTWKAWREYISSCRTKKARDKMAYHRAHHALVVKCWSGWREYIGIRRRKQRQTDKAMGLAEKQLKRRVWEHWLAQLAFKQNLKYMDREALEFWADKLMTKTWRIWTSACFVKTEEKENMKVASRFYDRTLVVRVWRGLKNFRSIKKLKQLRHGAAKRNFSLTLLRKSFQIWVARWQRQVELAQFDDLISFKGDVAVARRAFVHWKYYVVVKSKDYEKKEKADHHYTQHLLKTCFNALHLQAVQKRLKEMRLKMAKDLCQRFQLQRVWNMWLNRCEHSEELKLHSVSRKARAHYSFQLKRKLFVVWMRYCHWRRFRKSQYGKADFHFCQRALPRYFYRMMTFVDLMRSNKERNLAAETFRREALLAKMFYFWWSKYQLIMDVRMMERMAILHNDEVIKRRCLHFWFQSARKKLYERELEFLADDHRNRRLLLMGIARWREFNKEMKESRSVQRSSVRHYYIHLLKKTWEAWKQFVHDRQLKWQKLARADLHYQQRILFVVISAWKDHQNHAKAAKAHCDSKLQTHNLKRLRSAFETWKENVKENREERQNKHVAKTFLNQMLLSKCFSCWREFATHHAVKKWQQWQRVQEIQQIIEKGKLKRSFRAWKSFTRKFARDKILKHKADSHYNKILTCRAVLTWKSYVHLCFRIKILQRQSMWLHNRRITAAFFNKWKKQHSAVIQEKKQTVLALWHWSVNLQRRAFYAVLEYAICRKRKSVRITRALDDRRNRLLRTGVTRWMKVGFHLAAERSRLAQERQLEAAHSVHQCVYRCALHWRRITAKRVRQRGGRPRPSPVMEVNPDWSVASLSRTARPVPSAHCPSYNMDFSRIASVAFKERPRPRKPDYLRESFDLTQITMAINLPPSIPSTSVSIKDDDDETKPRPSPPRPSYQTRSNIHPLQRIPREESITFPSSSGEESFLGTEGSKGTSKDARDSTEAVMSATEHVSSEESLKPVPKPLIHPLVVTKQTGRADIRAVLLPPSSFTLPSRSNGTLLQPSLPEGMEVRASDSTHPASTPRTSLDSQKRAEASPSSAASSSNTGFEEEEEERDEFLRNEFDSEENKDEEEEGEVMGKERDEEEYDGEQDGKGHELAKAQEEAVKNKLLGQLREEEENLQRRIASMKNTLHEFQELKATYSHKKRQRDQLSVWVQEQRGELGLNHEDEELIQTEQCLDELTEEVNEMAQRIKQTRPLVEEVAVSIRELIHKTDSGSLS